LAEVSRQEYVDRAGLQPIIDSFGGSTMNEMLVNGAMQAAKILSNYVGALSYDKLAADELFNKIEAWQAANGPRLQQYIRSGAETIPEQIRLAFDSRTAQQFVVASFASAVQGLPAWRGSLVSTAVKVDPSLNYATAEADGKSRLITFSTIVLLERQGVLREIFNPPPGTNGFGNPLVIPVAAWWVIGVVAVAAVCGMVYLAINYQDQKRLNELLKIKCEASPDQCEKAIDDAIKAELERQKKPPLAQVSEAFGLKYLGVAAGVGILAYLGAKFVLPAWSQSKREES
ncbi:MAG: hypothetical protein EBS90_13235, partial [Betaproteobacteria bacterium]|nr:hypothetical protein [Betaproteobacteria bacterium]